MNKFAWAACALILSAHAPAMAQTAVQAAAAPSLPTADRGLFTAQDLFGMEVASDAQISPDGGQIAYVRQTADIMTDRMRPTIWLIDVKTGRHSPLIASAGSHRQPRWSPDGTRLSYISSAEGGAPQPPGRGHGQGKRDRVRQACPQRRSQELGASSVRGPGPARRDRAGRRRIRRSGTAGCR